MIFQNKFIFLLTLLLLSFIGDKSFGSECSSALNKLISAQKASAYEISFEYLKKGEAIGLKDELLRVYAKAFDMEKEDYQEVLHFIHEVESNEVFIAKSASGQHIGYTGLERGKNHPYLKDTRFQHMTYSYLSVAMIDPDFQGLGVYSKLNKKRLQVAVEHFPDIIFSRTQNPQVEKALKSKLNKLIQEQKIKDWHLTRIRKDGVYGQLLTREKFYVSDPEIQKAFDELSSENGDGYLLVFEVQYQ